MICQKTNENCFYGVESTTDYYPFGAPLDGRTFASEKYKFGFNGKEKDNEIAGQGNDYDFGERIYDSRLGRWMSMDKLFSKFPKYSPYNAFNNSPIVFTDPDGKGGILTINGRSKDNPSEYTGEITFNVYLYSDVYEEADLQKIKPSARAFATRANEKKAPQCARVRNACK